MTRRLPALLFCFGGAALAADPPPVDPARQAKFQAVVDAATADARVKQAELMEKFSAAIRALEADSLAKLWPLVEADPTDEIAFKVCRSALSNAPAGSPTRATAFGLLAKHHLGRPDIEAVLPSLTADPDGRDFLRTALDRAPDKHTRAMACFQLAVGPLAPGGPKPSDGTPAGRAAAAAERDTYLKRLETDFPAERPKKGRATLVESARGLILADSLIPGKPAPAAECPALDGTPARLADLKGKVVVLDFWATWCGPCKAMIPHQRQMVERLKTQPFALVSVSVDDKKETLTAFLKETPMPWGHWFSGPEGLAARWGVQSYPTVYVVDRNGVIRYKDVRGEKLDAAVDALLKEPQ